MCESNSLAYTQTSGGSGGGHHHHHHHNHHHHHHHPQVEHCVSIVDRNHNQTEHHPFYEHQQEQQKTATTFNTNNNNHETSLFSTNATIANSNSNSGNYYGQENGTNCNGVRTTTTNNNNDNSSGGGGGGCDNDDDNGGVCENDGRNQASTSKDEEEKNEDDEGRNHGSRFENAFQMRTINLTNFPNNSASSQRTSYRTVLNRARIGITTSTAKSLNILRQALQNRINAEINEILQKYLENYFQPAADNIRNNLGVNAISEQHLQQVCRQALEEAKNMYFGPLIGRSSCPASPAAGIGSTTTGGHQQLGIGVGVRETTGNPDRTNNNNNSCSSSHLNNSQHHHNPSDSENTFGGHHHHSTVHHKRKRRERRDSNDSTEDYGYNHGSALLKPINKKKRLKAVLGRGTSSGRGGGGHAVKNHTKVTDQIKRDGPRWDPNRLTTETKFVLGSKANKALGFGSTRGRLYTKHAGLFRYIGDAEDKQWLHEHGLMPLAGGRAYLLIKEDIENLIDSDEYRNAPGVNRNDMGDGFAVPESMIFKMKAIMAQMKTPEIVVTIKKDESDHSNVIIKNQFSNKDSTLTTATTNLNCNIANSHSMYEASSVGSNSNQLSVDTLRPPAQEDTSGAPSPADDLDCLNSTGLPSTNPSPFSGVGLSPANQEEVDEVSQSCLMDAEEQLRTSNGTSMNKIQI